MWMKSLLNFLKSSNLIVKAIIAIIVILLLYFSINKIIETVRDYQNKKSNQEIERLLKDNQQKDLEIEKLKGNLENLLNTEKQKDISAEQIKQKLSEIDKKIATINSNKKLEDVFKDIENSNLDSCAKCRRACDAAQRASVVSGKNVNCPENYCTQFCTGSSAR